MKINRTKLARIAGVILLTTLSGASSLLRADSGTCNGAGITIPFTDVAGNQFFCQIAEAYLSGLTNGTSAVTYSPHAPVPREQMAAFIVRALGEFNPPMPLSQRFLDVPPANGFYNFIDRLAALQITQGCGGGNFCPGSAVTRGQMAAFVVRAFNL